MPNTPNFYFLFVEFLYQHAQTKQDYLEKSVISDLCSEPSVLLAETGLEIPDFSFIQLSDCVELCLGIDVTMEVS